MTGPHQLCYVNCGLPADECACYRDIMSRAPAVLAALPEVQALIAAAIEDAARLCDAKHADYMISKVRDPEKYESAYSLLARSLRNLTPTNATAALAGIEAAAEARGRVKGMREAAEMFHEEQVRIWAEEILSSLALEGILSFGTYDKKVTAYVSVSNEINGISSAILARADQIEKDAK